MSLSWVAGSTILLGLPIARMPQKRPEPRAAVTAFATGILVFLLWDVLTNGVDPVQAALDARHWGVFAGRVALLAGGFTLGLMGLVYYDWWVKSRRASPLVGPGAAAVDEFRRPRGIHALSTTRRLALLIATGIGLHNFGEGLAIGQSAGSKKAERVHVRAPRCPCCCDPVLAKPSALPGRRGHRRPGGATRQIRRDHLADALARHTSPMPTGLE